MTQYFSPVTHIRINDGLSNIIKISRTLLLLKLRWPRQQLSPLPSEALCVEPCRLHLATFEKHLLHLWSELLICNILRRQNYKDLGSSRQNQEPALHVLLEKEGMVILHF